MDPNWLKDREVVDILILLAVTGLLVGVFLVWVFAFYW
jgi:hypothetical protein